MIAGLSFSPNAIRYPYEFGLSSTLGSRQIEPNSRIGREVEQGAFLAFSRAGEDPWKQATVDAAKRTFGGVRTSEKGDLAPRA